MKKKLPVTKTLKDGTVKTYLQNYYVSDNVEDINIINQFTDIKTKISIKEKYTITEYFSFIDYSNLNIEDVDILLNKCKSFIDIEILLKNILDNIKKIDINIIIYLFNSLDNKKETYKYIVDNINKSYYNFLLYLKDQPLLFSLIQNINTINSILKYSFPLENINKYIESNDNIYLSLILLYLYNNCNNKYIKNEILFTESQNTIYNTYLKSVDNSVDNNLYSIITIPINEDVALLLNKNIINLDKLSNEPLFYSPKYDIDSYKLVKDVNKKKIKNNTKCDVEKIGYYIKDNKIFLIVVLCILKENFSNFNFLYKPDDEQKDYIICEKI